MKLKSKIAFILIDMQEIPVSDLKEKDKKRILSAQLEMLKFCAIHSVHLVILEFIGQGAIVPKLEAEIKKVKQKVFLPRISYSGFTAPLLKKYLKKIKAEILVLMGVNGCVCVEETANEAIKQGFKIATAKNLVSGYREEVDFDLYKKNGLLCRSHKTLLLKLFKC